MALRQHGHCPSGFSASQEAAVSPIWLPSWDLFDDWADCLTRDELR
jgi:hypothetical protein